MAYQKGCFITVEGGEGAGKTTNIEYMAGYLQEKNIPFELTREPGGCQVSETIRNILLQSPDPISDQTELLLMFAARAQHLQDTILPALAQGKWVICDRFTDASYAYQGGGRGIDMHQIETLEQWIQGDFRPHKTLVLDLPVEMGMARAQKRGDLDRIEQEELSFFQRVREVYLDRARHNHEQFVVIDASQSLQHVQQQIKATLDLLIQGE